MQTLTRPEACKQLECIVECVPADGGGYWVQHNTDSHHVKSIPEGEAWCAAAHIVVATIQEAIDSQVHGVIVNATLAEAASAED